MQHFIAIAIAAAAASNAAAQQANRPDPADAKAPVPAHRYASAFKDYRPYADPQIGRWRHLNEEVGKPGGHARREAKPAAKAVESQGHGGHK